MVKEIDERDSKKISDLKSKLSAGDPKHVEALGRIIRSGSMASFRRHLVRMGISHDMTPRNLKLFRDYLTIQRIDLKDMEPNARKSLRMETLRDQSINQSEDYSRLVCSTDTVLIRCRDCKWFVNESRSRDRDGISDTCVQRGAKGSDFPCKAFECKQPTQQNKA